jgi:hypothetical protein
MAAAAGPAWRAAKSNRRARFAVPVDRARLETRQILGPFE